MCRMTVHAEATITNEDEYLDAMADDPNLMRVKSILENGGTKKDWETTGEYAAYKLGLKVEN